LNVSTSKNIRDALEDDVVTGRLAPGTKLDEAGLSKRFNVSRTPIREALRFLSEAGLVDLIPNRGAFVAEMSIPRLVEIFEVMAELEGMCGRLCARRMTNELSAALLATHEACRVARTQADPDEYYYRNEAFHDVIYQGGQNGFLAEQVKQLRSRLQPYRRMQLRLRSRLRASLDEHQAIVDAILAGEEETAASSLKSHVLVQGECFTDFVALASSGTAAAYREPKENR